MAAKNKKRFRNSLQHEKETADKRNLEQRQCNNVMRLDKKHQKEIKEAILGSKQEKVSFLKNIKNRKST